MDKKRTMHMIGCAHLDPVWLWPWTEGMSEIKSTFQAALDRLEEFPDFLFTCSGAAYYEWLEEAFPDLFAKIRHYVAQGRWIITGGQYVQPDLNIPCGEALARHSLYSQRYYLEKFGRLCDVGYNVDSFGHSGMLPQILRLSGMKGYIFSRPRPNENGDIPYEFTWESADGSRVTGVRLLAYAGPARRGTACPELFQDRLRTRREMGSDLPGTYFYGVGNHGGGPTIALLRELERIMQEDPQVIYSFPGKYISALEQHTLPVWNQDLQVHAIGCYSAYLPVKQLNRQAETGLLSAEGLGVLAHQTLGSKMRTARLKDGWKRVMWNQFHDVICGCSIPQAYRDAAASYGYAQEIANEQANRALQQLTWNIDTLGDDTLPCSKDENWRLWGYGDKGTPLVIYNPMPFPVEMPVEAAGLHREITDHQGDPVRIQTVRNAVTSADEGWNHQYQTLFMAKLPPMGYATYWLKSGQSQVRTDRQLRCTAYSLENAFLKVELHKESGGIAQLTCKETGKAYFSAPGCTGIVIDEHHSDTWGHGLFAYRDAIGSFSLQTTEILEAGPVRARLRTTATYGNSCLRTDYILDRNARHLDIKQCITWNEQHKMLKLEFPVATHADTYTAEIPYGIIRRKADGTEKPLQRFLDVSGEGLGLCVVNDSTYGADVLGSTIRMTVLRSPKFADHNGAIDQQGNRDSYGEFTEQGQRFVSFRLVPHQGDWRKVNPHRHAAIVNTPLHLVYETYHKGSLPQQLSGISIDRENVTAIALKEAEEGNAYILRLCEQQGADTTATISLPLIDRQWTADFGHYQIKTFRIPFDQAAPITEVNLLEL